MTSRITPNCVGHGCTRRSTDHVWTDTSAIRPGRSPAASTTTHVGTDAFVRPTEQSEACFVHTVAFCAPNVVGIEFGRRTQPREVVYPNREAAALFEFAQTRL